MSHTKFEALMQYPTYTPRLHCSLQPAILSPEAQTTDMILPSASVPATQDLSAAVLADDQAIRGLLQRCLAASGLNMSEVARRIGISPAAFGQVFRKRTQRPSLWWVARFVQVCGGSLVVNLPRKPVA